MSVRVNKIGRLSGVDIFLNWTMWAFPVFIFARAWFFYPLDEAILQLLLVGGLYVCLLMREFGKLQVAVSVGLGLREIIFYPIGAHLRLAVMSERPKREICVAAVGPIMHLLIAGALAGGIASFDDSLVLRLGSTAPYVETFCNRLMWLNLFFVVMHIIPAMPFDGGFIFRGALALSAGRMRATEVAALLSSFVALLTLAAGMIWMGEFWWLIMVGIIVHVSGQQELMTARFFNNLQEPDKVQFGRSPTLAPLDHILDHGVRLPEPEFTGIIWHARNRLWVVYRGGQPVSANALVGE